MILTPSLDIHAQAFELARQGNVRAKGQPAIYTSGRRLEADAHVRNNPGTTLIHYTPAGEALERLNLFTHMPHRLAYLYWFILSARFIITNNFPDEVVLFGDPNDSGSTAFNLETPLLIKHHPNVQSISNGVTGEIILRTDWAQAGLVRPDFIRGRIAANDDTPGRGRILFKPFNAAASPQAKPQDFAKELRLKLVLKALLQVNTAFLQPQNPSARPDIRR